MKDLTPRVRNAVRHFWRTRQKQGKAQGKKGKKDQGSRTEVTGGAHLDGFVFLLRDMLIEEGVPPSIIYCKNKLELPGYYRPTKKWDLLVVKDGALLAAVELKAQIGPSFGNNANNRAEEAVGNGVDFMRACESGLIPIKRKPWLGYFFLLEDCAASTKAAKKSPIHFPIDRTLVAASYTKRYEELGRRLVATGVYDGACLVLSRKCNMAVGTYSEPDGLGFRQFVDSLISATLRSKGSS